MSEPPPRWRGVVSNEISHSTNLNNNLLEEQQPNMVATLNNNYNNSLLDFRQANLALTEKIQHNNNVGDLLHAVTVSTIDLGIQQLEQLDHGNVTHHLVLTGGSSSSPTTSEFTEEINSFYFYKVSLFW